jgi:hypothetical protein
MDVPHLDDVCVGLVFWWYCFSAALVSTLLVVVL